MPDEFESLKRKLEDVINIESENKDELQKKIGAVFDKDELMKNVNQTLKTSIVDNKRQILDLKADVMRASDEQMKKINNLLLQNAEQYDKKMKTLSKEMKEKLGDKQQSLAMYTESSRLHDESLQPRRKIDEISRRSSPGGRTMSFQGKKHCAK